MSAAASRQRAVETAAELFQRQGYTATGLRQIIEESGSPKGSFYFNFPGGKEELGIAALDLSGERLHAAISGLAEVAETPLEFVRSLCGALAAELEGSDFTVGCPVAVVALETASASDGLRAAARTQFASWEEAIARGVAGRDAVPSEHHRTVAGQVLMLLEGALLMSRVQQSTEPLWLLAPAFERLVD
jgi:TetR/AcrR family transcriptional regulator, lmrAB and yxaGH operons repressor